MDVFEVARGLSDSKIVQRKLRLQGLRFHFRFAVGCELVGCTRRVAALPRSSGGAVGMGQA